MQKVRVWEPSEPVPAGEWERRLADSEAEIVAVLEPDQDEVLPALVLQLGNASLISAYSPVTDALKVVLDGLVFSSYLFIVSLGLTIIFGVMKVLNLAHGGFYAWGAYTSAFLIGRAAAAGWPDLSGFAIIFLAALVVAILIPIVVPRLMT